MWCQSRVSGDHRLRAQLQRQRPHSRSAAPPATSINADCLVTAITVQVPFDLVLPDYFPFGSATVAITENTNTSQAFQVIVARDLLRVMTTCELAVSSQGMTTPCAPAVTHSDGQRVSAANPAKAGEEVVLYAVGLGLTTPQVKAGDATPGPAPSLDQDVFVQFDFRPNATPSRPYVDDIFPYITSPIFVGLTPGQVGVYQINIKLPNTFPHVQPCVNSSVIIVGGLSTIVQSNLTIDFGGINGVGLGSVGSFDGAAICVEPTV